VCMHDMCDTREMCEARKSRSSRARRASSRDPCMRDVWGMPRPADLRACEASDPSGYYNVAHLKAYFVCRSNSQRYGYGSFMSYISRVLSDISTVHEITASRDEYAWIVYALASEIAHAEIGTRWRLYANQWPQSVRQALRAVVHAGLDPHQTSGKLESPYVSDEWYQDLNMTPLGLLCIEALRIRVKSGYGTQSEWNGDLNTRLQTWLSGLESAGIDLLQYAESEFLCFGSASNSLIIPWKTDGMVLGRGETCCA
jgi:hypothetical protein